MVQGCLTGISSTANVISPIVFSPLTGMPFNDIYECILTEYKLVLIYLFLHSHLLHHSLQLLSNLGNDLK